MTAVDKLRSLLHQQGYQDAAAELAISAFQAERALLAWQQYLQRQQINEAFSDQSLRHHVRHQASGSLVSA